MPTWNRIILILVISYLSSAPNLLHSQPALSNLNTYSRAVQLMGAKQYNQALELFESVRNEYYRYRAAAKIIEIHKITGRLDGAEAYYRNLLADDSTNTAYLYGLAHVAYQRGDYDSVISQINKAIRSGNKNCNLKRKFVIQPAPEPSRQRGTHSWQHDSQLCTVARPEGARYSAARSASSRSHESAG